MTHKRLSFSTMLPVFISVYMLFMFGFSSKSVRGRYIKVYKEEKGCISITEIEVWNNNNNIALGKPVSAANSHFGTSPDAAVDGNTKSLKDFIYISKPAAGNWIIIDLQQTVDIEKIELHNRSQSPDNIIGHNIAVLDAKKNTVWSEKINSQDLRHSYSFTKGKPAGSIPKDTGSAPVMTLSESTAPSSHSDGQARYVKIYKTKKGVISLVECEVLSGDVNIAKDKPCTSANTHFGTLPSALVDGNTKSLKDFLYISKPAENNWIQIDLQNAYIVEKIIVHNRSQSPEHIKGCTVALLDSSQYVIWSEVISGQEMKYQFDF